MERWLQLAILSLLFWSIWGVALKAASKRLEWFQVYVYSNTAVLLMTLAIAVMHRNMLAASTEEAVLAFAAGLTGTLGYIALVGSLSSGGKASVVIPLTALYPAVTALLSILVLGEHVSPRQAMGVALAVAAIMLLS